MALKTLFHWPRNRAPRKPNRDWSRSFTPRDWADLPVHHPRQDDEAV